MLELVILGTAFMAVLFVLWLVFAALGLVVKIALIPVKLAFGLIGGILLFLVVLPLVVALLPLLLVFGGFALVAGLIFGLGRFVARA